MTTEQIEASDRVRSYLKHQGGKSPQAIRELVVKGHAQLLDRIDGLSEEQATFKPEPDVWSVVEVLQHAAPAKRWVADLCGTLARGATPERGGGNTTYASLAEARSALEAAQLELLAFSDGLSPDANVEARFEHSFFGELNCREWAAFQRVHDGDHAEQIDQVRAAPGFPAA